MRLHSIVEIHKAAQFFLPVLRAVKLLLFMPHLHNRPYHPFGFAVSLRTGRTGKLLIDAVFKTGNAERMVDCAFVLAAVVRIDAVNLVRTGFDYLFAEKLGCALGSLVRQDGGVQLA